MDKLIDALVQNAPSMTIGVIVLILMLRHNEKQNKSMRDVTDDFRQSIRNQAESCHSVQRESNEVIRDNTAALSKLSTLIEIQNQHHRH